MLGVGSSDPQNDGAEGYASANWPGQGEGQCFDMPGGGRGCVDNGTLCPETPGVDPDFGYKSPCALVSLSETLPGSGPRTPGMFYSAPSMGLTPFNDIVISFMLKVGDNFVNGLAADFSSDNYKLMTFQQNGGSTDWFIKLAFTGNPAGDYRIYLETEYTDDSRYPPDGSGFAYNNVKGGSSRTIIPHFEVAQYGEWLAVQVRYKVQTQDLPGNFGSDGLAALWINECGALDLGCTSGTGRNLIGSLSNFDFGDPSNTFRNVFLEFWENPFTNKAVYIDDLAVRFDGVEIPIRTYHND